MQVRALSHTRTEGERSGSSKHHEVALSALLSPHFKKSMLAGHAKPSALGTCRLNLFVGRSSSLQCQWSPYDRKANMSDRDPAFAPRTSPRLLDYPLCRLCICHHLYAAMIHSLSNEDNVFSFHNVRRSVIYELLPCVVNATTRSPYISLLWKAIETTDLLLFDVQLFHFQAAQGIMSQNKDSSVHRTFAIYTSSHPQRMLSYTGHLDWTDSAWILQSANSVSVIEALFFDVAANAHCIMHPLLHSPKHASYRSHLSLCVLPGSNFSGEALKRQAVSTPHDVTRKAEVPTPIKSARNGVGCTIHRLLNL